MRVFSQLALLSIVVIPLYHYTTLWRIIKATRIQIQLQIRLR